MRHPAVRRPLAGLLALLAFAPAALGSAGAAVASSPHRSAAEDEARITRLTAARVGTNPLADRPWGVYKGSMEQAWDPYARATGEERELLGTIALRPKAKWFGAWVPTGDIRAKVRQYVAGSTGGDPETLVQLAVFRMEPWEHEACRRLPSAAEQESYRRWIDELAAGIGTAHVALILQPDGPFALCAPGGSTVPSRLIRYSARVLGSLANTSVYIDAGAADWNRDDPARALAILRPAGIRFTRGFALNSTHYVTTAREVRYGAAVVRALEAAGLPGKRFVVNTSSNGRGFAGYRYPGPVFDHARACTSSTDRLCVTLGIPPTDDVADPRWGLTEKDRRKALRFVDAYLWFGRPWLHMQAAPFDTERALQLARTTPY